MARVARGMRAAVRRMKKEVDTLDRDQRTGVPAMSKTAREDASPRLELSMGASKARGALKEAKGRVTHIIHTGANKVDDTPVITDTSEDSTTDIKSVDDGDSTDSDNIDIFG